jgi:hypothetical protein
MEQETIDGYNIPSRELTEEEATRPLTTDRIRNYEVTVGESFLDTHGSSINLQAIMGFLMARYPEKASELLEMGNNKFGDLNDLNDIFVPSEWTEKLHCEMLQNICDFINLTVSTKKRINKVLIIVDEHYNKK